MRRTVVPLVVAVLFAAGCADGGGTTAESPSATRSADRSADRSVTASPGQRTREAQPAPTTEAPPREEPTTEAPAPPRETETVERTVTRTATATATATATQTTREAETPTVSPSPVASEEETSPLMWLWILLACAVVGLIVWLMVNSRSRTTPEDAWDAKVVEVAAQGAALRDAIGMTRAEQGADVRRADIQSRADMLVQSLYLLRETAPSQGDRLRVNDVLAALQSVRQAMEAGQPVQERLATFEYTLNMLRAPASQYPSG
ncbi:hypothetical protein [Spirillospora sp. NPDC047279]|uniref:hypothetical protein n=1 Tax=Spirillospora sp. NPDC047279 TaxID=3155478 RepID=UPI0033D52D73